MKITAIIPSYNHAQYVGRAIESAMNQTRPPDEIIVIDDASSDESRSVISSYNVRKIFLDKNRGGAEALNIAILESEGDHVAILNSDDVWAPKKLERQESYLDTHKNCVAVFSQVNFIDENENLVPGVEYGSKDIFKKKCRNRGEYLRHFFFDGNCLCHPSVLIRKSIYGEVGMYNNALRQLPDLDMWVRILKRYPIEVLDEPLVSFRLFKGLANTSGQTYRNRARTVVEQYHLAGSFFDGLADDQFIEAFRRDIRYEGKLSRAHIAIEKALLFLAPDQKNVLAPAYRLVGMDLLMKLYQDAHIAEVLSEDYRLDAHFIHVLTESYDIFLKENFLQSGGIKAKVIGRFLERSS